MGVIGVMIGTAAGHGLDSPRLGNRAPVKDDTHIMFQAGNNPRQGGDTIADATPIADIPFTDSGTTAEYIDDYDEACPYSGSTSPDVVYSFTAGGNGLISIDLCGSAYDTKIFVYDEGLDLVACNDDFYFDDVCGVYVSKLETVVLFGEVIYYIVIDGYGGDFGDYELDVYGLTDCYVECPDGAALEGEPEIMDGYVDWYNGGCGTDQQNVLDYIQVVQDGEFCAVSGWYDDGFRDTDWFSITLTSYGSVVWECDAEQPTYMFELLNAPDCANVEVGQIATAGPCLPASLTLFGEPDGEVYFWAGPTNYYPPSGFIGHEYDYINHFDINVIATEDATWSQLKAMYR